ncbi:unnamed protein product, partial [Candidula unifasciata]
DTRCNNGGRCLSQGTQARCECPQGFSGLYCDTDTRQADPCLNYRCSNGGQCYIQGVQPYCQCPRGYMGPRCENTS